MLWYNIFHMNFSKIKGPFLIFLSAVLFGSYGLWAVLVGSDFGPFFQGYVRAFFILLILVPLAFFTKAWKPFTLSDGRKYFWTMFFGIFTQAPLYYAFQNAGIGISSLIFFSLLLITSYIIGFTFLNEKVTKIKIISLVIAIGGLVLTFGSSVAHVSVVALLLAALNGVASGGELATTKLIPEKFSTLQTSIMIWATILITHLPLSFLFHERQIPFSFNTHWIAMIGFTLAGVVAFWLVVEGYKYVDASIGGLIGLLEIVFSIMLGIIVFHESLTLAVFIGLTLIIIASILPHYYELKLTRNKFS